MQKQWEISYLESENAPYLENLYRDYCSGKKIEDAQILAYFQSISPKDRVEIDHNALIEEIRREAEEGGHISSSLDFSPSGLEELIASFRRYGHRLASLDPLNLSKPLGHEKLSLDYYGLQHDSQAKEIYDRYLKIYSHHIAYEFAYIEEELELNWLEHEIEKNAGELLFSIEEKKGILTDLIASEGLEKFLGRRYVGKTRFSIEGLDSLIPCMNEIVNQASLFKTDEIMIGMAHRGRLNVMVNVLGMKPSYLVDFMDSKLIDANYAGDVVYHIGFSSKMNINEQDMMLSMAFNPSHLEIISPVVMGAVKAKQKSGKKVLSVLLHGDAAFAGQGVVMESFAMSQASGYEVGGAIHIATNNQVGFTTSDASYARSSLYCSDIAKMINAPVFHVNADDPEAVIWVTRLAMRYREKFKKDVVIDLVGYRRYGHNEADEPSATQPMMYNAIRKHLALRTLYSEKIINEGVLTQDEVNQIVLDYQNALESGNSLKSMMADVLAYQTEEEWAHFLNKSWRVDYDSGISLDQLTSLGKALSVLPEEFILQAQVKRIMDARKKMIEGEIGLDWGMAENLAYASLLSVGYGVRLSGEDVRRGTFAHRHAVFHDQETGKTFMPLNSIHEKQAKMTIVDSLLSEEAVMAFEYGYSTAESHDLIIWEAQYGDFFNGAQVVVDQFISAGEQKWKQLSGLVLLLPHSFEGAGPEHSSARLERFLQLCAQENMQVCVPSTPAQIFHLLRRQVLRSYKKPLIVMTPKSILRHKLAISNLSDFTNKNFELVIGEKGISHALRVILCSGKIYYDLLMARMDSSISNIAIIRIEQLYPFPKEEVMEALLEYKAVSDIVWCQEEPKNQGAWSYIRDEIEACLNKDQKITYLGRPASASPATGFAKVHMMEQANLVKQALNLS